MLKVKAMSDSVCVYCGRYAGSTKDKAFYTVTVTDEDGNPFRLYCNNDVYNEAGKFNVGQSVQPSLRIYSGTNGKIGVQCEGFFTVT